MIQKVISQLLLFALLVLLQALIFNNIHIAGYAVPLPYLYFLLILPSDTGRSMLLLWGFALGFAVDIFSNTHGIASAATTLAAFVRPYVLNIFVPHDKEEERFTPSPADMKWGPFVRYSAILLLIHEAAFFTIEAFSFFNWEALLINTGSSFALTLLIICMFESIHSGGKGMRKKR